MLDPECFHRNRVCIEFLLSTSSRTRLIHNFVRQPILPLSGNVPWISDSATWTSSPWKPPTVHLVQRIRRYLCHLQWAKWSIIITYRFHHNSRNHGTKSLPDYRKCRTKIDPRENMHICPIFKLCFCQLIPKTNFCIIRGRKSSNLEIIQPLRLPSRFLLFHCKVKGFSLALFLSLDMQFTTIRC